MKRVWIFVASLILLTLGVVTWLGKRVDPPVETIVATSLKAVQEQNRLTVFSAHFVTVVTSRKGLYGLNAEKTMIVPAMVRYEIDLAQLKSENLSWNAATRTLTVKLPPVALGGPEFDLAQTREYETGMVLLTLTDVERRLDAENRQKASKDVLQQARSKEMMKFARDAAHRAVANSFALPLKAAGVEAKVEVEIEE